MSRKPLNCIKHFIRTTIGGYVVFFPFGPFRGYLLPSSEFTAMATKTVMRFHGLSLLCLPLTFGVSAAFKISIDHSVWMLFGPIYVLFLACVWRITRKLEKLPFRLSATTYAATAEPEELMQFVTSFALLTGMIGLLLFLMPFSVSLWWLFVSSIGRTASYAYVASLISQA